LEIIYQNSNNAAAHQGAAPMLDCVTRYTEYKTMLHLAGEMRKKLSFEQILVGLSNVFLFHAAAQIADY
jgi:hypothetical protein